MKFNLKLEDPNTDVHGARAIAKRVMATPFQRQLTHPPLKLKILTQASVLWIWKLKQKQIVDLKILDNGAEESILWHLKKCTKLMDIPANSQMFHTRAWFCITVGLRICFRSQLYKKTMYITDSITPDYQHICLWSVGTVPLSKQAVCFLHAAQRWRKGNRNKAQKTFIQRDSKRAATFMNSSVLTSNLTDCTPATTRPPSDKMTDKLWSECSIQRSFVT